MKGLKILLAAIMVATFASIAIAQNITVNGTQYSCGSAIALANLQMDNSGDITITYSCGTTSEPGPTPTPTPTPTGTPAPTPTPTPVPGSGGVQGTQLSLATGTQTFNIAPNGTALYYQTITSPCTGQANRLLITKIQQQSAPNVVMIVKKTNGNATNPPTLADYNTLLQQAGGWNLGEEDFVSPESDGGIYFVNFETLATSQNIQIYPSTSYPASLNFGSQADTYYVLLVNTVNTQATGFLSVFGCH